MNIGSIVAGMLSGVLPVPPTETQKPAKQAPLIDRETALWLGLAGIAAQAFGGGGAELINGFTASRKARGKDAPPVAEPKKGEQSGTAGGDQKKQGDAKLGAKATFDPWQELSAPIHFAHANYYPELDWDWSDGVFRPYEAR